MTISVSSGLRAKSRGFTLTELAIVLSIMGLILGAIWTAASKVYFNQKTTHAVTQTLAIVEAVKAAFPNGTTGASNGTPLTSFVINSGMAPTDTIQSCTGLPFTTGASYSNGTNCIVGPWQNQIFVGANAGFYGVAGDPHHFEVATQSAGISMSSTQCASFLAAFVPAAVNDGLVNVAYNNAGGAVTVAVSSTTSPTIFSDCTGGAAGILFQFSL